MNKIVILAVMGAVTLGGCDAAHGTKTADATPVAHKIPVVSSGPQAEDPVDAYNAFAAWGAAQARCIDHHPVHYLKPADGRGTEHPVMVRDACILADDIASSQSMFGYCLDGKTNEWEHCPDQPDASPVAAVGVDKNTTEVLRNYRLQPGR